VKYKLGVYIPEDDILHSHRRENFKSYIVLLLLMAVSYGSLFWSEELSPAKDVLWIEVVMVISRSGRPLLHAFIKMY
jgi:hypothetical protein